MRLFRLIITTAQVLTIEEETLEAAQEYAARIEKEFQDSHHHGENTTVELVEVQQI